MGAELEFEVVVDDCGCRSRSQVVQGEAVSKSVSAGGGERAGLGFSWKCSSWPQGVLRLLGTHVLGAL